MTTADLLREQAQSQHDRRNGSPVRWVVPSAMDPVVGAALADLLDAFDARRALPTKYGGLSDHQLYLRMIAEEQADKAIWTARDALVRAIENGAA